MTVVNVHQEIVERFKRLVKAGRLAHAYLFTGPSGIGKTETALELAQLVNCDDNSACGNCAQCRKIASGNHPDVYVIGTDGEGIKIDDVRQMLGRVGLRAYEAKRKVFILRQVERMTMEAANALLKTLEEPAANTLMILTTAVPEAVLDTVKSRCHTVKFFASEDKLPEDKDTIVSRFVARLFAIESEVEALAASTADQDPVFRFKIDFVRRRVLPALKKSARWNVSIGRRKSASTRRG